MMDFRDWLIKNEACGLAMDWFDQQPDQSPEAIWKACPRGHWLLCWHERAGTPWEELEPVVRRAVNRALKRAGVDFVVNSLDDYDAARKAAESARAAWEAESALVAESAWAAAAARVAALAAWVAAGAARMARAARAAENQQCADDCRELLSVPKWNKGE